MLVVIRYRLPTDGAAGFVVQARVALDALRRRSGCLGGEVARAIDDPTLWVTTTLWKDVGSYRRALSAHEVKLFLHPLLVSAIDEPTAFEVLTDQDGEQSALASDANVVGIGQAAAPRVPTDLD